MSNTTAGNLINRSRKQSIIINKTSKEQSTVKKLASSSASGRKMSFTSTMLASRVGSLARRSILISSEGKSFERGSIAGCKPPIQVFDDIGKDVTPRPLYQPEPSVAGPTPGPMHRPSKILSTQDFAGAVPTEFLSSLSLQQASGTSISLAGPFSRTYGSSSITKSTTSTESLAEEIIEPGTRHEALASFIDVQVRREAVPESLTKRDLEKRVDIFLTETETIWLFDMPTVMLSTESEEADSVRKKNVAYMELCKNRAGNDRYVNRMMQTIGGAPKTKEMQCDKIIMDDKEIMATTWDLYDSFNALEAAIAEKSIRPVSVTSSKSTLYRERDRAMSVASVGRESTTSSIIDLESVILSRIHEEIEDHSEAILKSEKFNQDLFYMERVLMENIFQPKLAAYRQLPVLLEPTVKSEHSLSIFEEESIKEEEEEEEDALSVRSSLLLDFSSGREEILPPYIECLWTYACDLMRGNNVSCLAWNKVNPDLLAVGYGKFRFKEQKKGLACCWSLKNPTWPERVYQSPHGVTALDFSLANPNLLAVGLYNGTIAVYNVQTHHTTSVLDTSESYDKHLGPVWQLRWVEQDRGITGEDKGEILVSISADGRVTKWFVRKGLSCNDLMKLKRTASDKKKGGAEKKSEALISRQAPGLSFDFHPKDTNIYLVGTEEGFIHKCSCSYNEQYLETYRGHKGPVYKIAWNPFSTEVFLSCSADWSIILWREDSVRPVLTFSSTANVIYDIVWSPNSAYVFAAANETRVEIWDLSVSTLDPLIVHPATGTVKFTAVLFAKNADCLLIGDSEGSVTVYALRNMIPSDRKKVRSAALKAEVAYANQGPF
uniref:WD repeat-containing protein 78 isoform X1 n=1 Tax=Podarcis muralis TaxID=64176 RepID=UPI00109F19CC|nr:WD repeat-containing protein 78 isoform X1 [Podarcis muralis]XP_028588975.1 WD repeat-containing protein 78 isoform X1 [Podarcis muralis]XP_028588976.1 WD repeat-containing protein 78 isoform X1 [Podarcis muralis]